MNFLLTGATGYLGSHLLKELLKDGHKVVILKRSTSNTHRIDECLDKVIFYDLDTDKIEDPFLMDAPFDAVIHTATCYGRKGESLSDIIESNLLFPLKLLELASDGGAGLFINTDTSLPRELNTYALSKKQFAEWGQRLHGAGKIRWINMVIEHFYGPGDDETKFLTWLVRSCLINVPEIHLTKGEQRRDFIHVKDVVRAFQTVLCAQSPEQSVEYAVGYGESVTVRYFAEMVHRLSSSRSLLRFGAVPYRADEEMESCADISALIALGWSPKIGLEDGLKKTIFFERTGSTI